MVILQAPTGFSLGGVGGRRKRRKRGMEEGGGKEGILKEITGTYMYTYM